MIVKVNNNFYSELFFHVHATLPIDPGRRHRWPVSKIITRLSKSDVKNSKLTKSLKSQNSHLQSSKLKNLRIFQNFNFQFLSTSCDHRKSENMSDLLKAAGFIAFPFIGSIPGGIITKKAMGWYDVSN